MGFTKRPGHLTTSPPDSMRSWAELTPGFHQLSKNFIFAGNLEFFFSFSFDSKLSSKGSAYICSMTDSQLSRIKWHKYLLKPLLKTAYVVLIKITVFSLLLLTSHIMYSKRKLINYRKAKRNLASLKIFFSPKLCRSFCKASFSFFRFIELYKIPCM